MIEAVEGSLLLREVCTLFFKTFSQSVEHAVLVYHVKSIPQLAHSWMLLLVVVFFLFELSLWTVDSEKERKRSFPNRANRVSLVGSGTYVPFAKGKCIVGHFKHWLFFHDIMAIGSYLKRTHEYLRAQLGWHAPLAASL